MDSIKFQADADLNVAIVTGTILRQPKVDFQTANEAGLAGIKDANVLAICAKQQRILVSHDRRTMPAEFATFLQHSQSAGVLIVSKKVPLETVISELVLIWSASYPSEWINCIFKIPL